MIVQMLMTITLFCKPYDYNKFAYHKCHRELIQCSKLDTVTKDSHLFEAEQRLVKCILKEDK